jgi:CBS domain-containing protein
MKKKYDADIIKEFLDNDPEAVDNEYLLEDVILKIKELNEDIVLIEENKKDAVSVFDDDINSVQGLVDHLKEIIMLTCNAKKEDAFKFDGVGIASKTKGRTNWVINDKDVLRAYLDKKLSQDEKEEVFIPQPDSIAKKKLDAILERWEKAGSLPGCVDKITNKPSIKVRPTKEKAEKEEEDDLDDIGF